MSPVTPVAPSLGRFVKAELAVITLLADLVDGHADVETPSDLEKHLPFVRVSRIGGQGTRESDSPRIDVDVFVARGSRSDGEEIAADCYARLLSFPHVIPDVGVIDTVAVDVSPNEVPWPNAAVLQFTSSYSVTVRRPSA